MNAFTNYNTDFFNITEYEREQLVMLDNLADELMLENIKEQIDERIQNDDSVNYINIFEERYNYLNEKFNEVPDIKKQLQGIRDEYFFEINNYLYEVIGVKANIDNRNYISITKTIYEFFILNYRENLISYLYNFIFVNKNSIVNKYESEEKKTVDVITLKKTLSDKNDIIILTNIYSIVNDILAMECDYYTLIKYIIEDDPDEKTNFIIKTLFSEIEFTDKIFIKDELVELFFKPLVNKEQNSTNIYFTLQTLIYESSIKNQEEL